MYGFKYDNTTTWKVLFECRTWVLCKGKNKSFLTKSIIFMDVSKVEMGTYENTTNTNLMTYIVSLKIEKCDYRTTLKCFIKNVPNLKEKGGRERTAHSFIYIHVEYKIKKIKNKKINKKIMHMLWQQIY